MVEPVLRPAKPISWEDADDYDALRTDPLFKLASGKAPENSRDLCSQPTMSRSKNAPSRIEVARMTAALVDLFCHSFWAPTAVIALDIDDTCDAVYGHQQLSLFHAHNETRGFDARYIVTSLGGDPRHLYENIYCARGQAENLIKMHEGQLASDRTSCQSPLANQLRLVLHTAAYWLMLALRDAIPRAAMLARAEFATLKLRLFKISAHVVEKATRVSDCPDDALFRLLAGRLAAAGPRAPGRRAPITQAR